MGELSLTYEQLSLLIADALQAIGGVLDAKWVIDGKVEVGTLCNAQGWFALFGWRCISCFFVCWHHSNRWGDSRCNFQSCNFFLSQCMEQC